MTTTAVVRRREVIQPGPAEALGALLGVTVPDLAGEGIPLLWHWLYLLDRPATADLGADGHPVRGTIPAPPGSGRRRMWAGGSVTRLAPLRVGEEAVRESVVESITDKDGRTGRLTFVTVRHRVTQAGRLTVDERQDIVYRDLSPAPTASAEPEPVVVPAGADERTIDVTPVLLFRYSALTYNGHRIHYDREYATLVEGYPGLVTHGPLQALAMAEAARAAGLADAPVLTFDYRLVAPLFDDQGLIARAFAAGGTVTTRVRDRTGRETAHGTLSRHP
ncbi:MaoC family dehydratase N-terminal domain-containing protein [Micromonospora sp. HUAS LYJ1]|uniref:FAS1-like dehydratase domain-containing protein n=1 Tax=Micromonospora sp. HUAS LYJ1 TaxID=3061626 RepID=UPI0026711DAC|nr:MaoC family dehydratase N-terminal domain-containing protein [Micromonospora sp. HUAS LYJ1]WKU03556.1 MaoC family dehydratase N-terminal domain-containing protein [Micromonospora sp. HUAS LYJ1]